MTCSVRSFCLVVRSLFGQSYASIQVAPLFVLGILALLVALATPRLGAQAQTATRTALTGVTGSFNQETLMATVTAGSTAVYPGTVTFYDGKTVLGSRQLVSSTQGASAQGTAVLRLILGPTTHSFSALFSPKYPYSGSTSAVLSVTGNATSTITTIAASGSNPYTLQGVVTGTGPGSLANSILFVDSGTNQQLASASPGGPIRTLAFPAAPSLTVGAAPQGVAVSDLNGDGIADIVTTSSSGNTVSVLLGNGDGTFTLASTSPTGIAPISVAVGDFNNDGIADLAVANNGDNTVSILLGTGSGAFTVGSTITAGNGLHDIKIADFNQDGILDLAVVNSIDNTCEELLGNGDGTFQASGTQSTGQQPSALTIADLNGDGIPDLAVINTADNTLTVLLGQGDGPPAKAKGSPISTLSGPTSIVSGDFNGDGIPDLAVVSYSLQKVQVFLGQGGGTFAALASTAAGNSPSGLVVGDFNADGLPDLATADTQDNTISVLLGNGDGTFAFGALANTGAGPTALAAGDLNGDGIPDLAVTDPSSNSVTVLLTYLTQTATATATGVGVSPGTHAVDAQFTGTPDFLPSTSGTINLAGSLIPTQVSLSESAIASNPGQLVTFTATLSPSSAQGRATNGEGITFYVINAQNVTKKLGTVEIVSGVASLHTSTLPTGQDTVYADYLGDATFASSQSTNLTFTVNALKPTATVTTLILSASAHGVPTLVAIVTPGNDHTVYPGVVQFYDGSILLGSAQLVPVSGSTQSMATLTASVDIRPGDTLYAKFLGTEQYATSSATYVAPAAKQGSGSIALTWSKVHTDPSATNAAARPDFHRLASAASAASTPTYTFTGTVTLIGSTAPTGTVSFVDTSNNNTVLATAPLGPATFTFASVNAPTPNVGKSPDAVASRDFNNDGIADLAIANRADNTLTILLGNGDGTFTQQVSPSTGSGPVSVAVGDFNSDGFADLAVANENDNTVSVLLGTGSGAFTPAALLSTGQQPSSVATIDLNGDGIADLVVANSTDSSVTVLLGNGDGTFYLFGTQATGAAPSSIATGDFNGDGVADLVTANLSANTLTILLGNGDGSFKLGSSPTIAAGAVSVAVQDLNGDGIADLAAVSPADGTVTVLLGNGDGSFKSPSTTSTGSPATWITAADFNQDGIVDLAVANSGANLVTVLLGKGDGTFIPGLTEVTGAGPTSLAVGDFNDDGLPDLAVANLSSDSVTISLTQATATSTAVATGVPILGTGNHAITAQTNGTTTTPAATSAPVSLAAAPLGTTLTLGSAAASSTFGQPVTLIATLSPASAQGHNANGETVTFYNNGIKLGTSTLNGGIASLQESSLSAASYSFTAAYGGDTNFTASNAAAFAYQVAAATPTITFNVGSSAAYGQSFQLSATSNSPGAITYSLGSGPAMVTSSGTVTVTGEGMVVVQANQAASGSYASASKQATLNAVKASTATTLSATATRSGNGTAAMLTATVAPQYTGTPGGSVTFYDGKTQLAMIPVTSGTATYTTAPLVGASHSLSATYIGDANFTSSISNSVNLTIAGSTAVSLQLLSTRLVYPEPPVFAVRVGNGAQPAPTGTVTIYDGSTAVATYPLFAITQGNLIGLVLPPLNVGTHMLQAVYSGDANHAPGQSPVVQVTVTPGPVKLTLQCASTQLKLSQTLSCTVDAREGLLPVAGVVAYTVTNGGQGLVSLSRTGQAAIAFQPNAKGSFTLTANYAAQGNYQAAQPASVTFTVN